MLIVLHWFLSNISKEDLWPSPSINYALRSCQEIPLRSEASRVILNSTKVCNNSTRNCTKVLSRKNDGVSYMLVVAGQVDSSSNQSWSKWSRAPRHTKDWNFPSFPMVCDALFIRVTTVQNVFRALFKLSEGSKSSPTDERYCCPFSKMSQMKKLFRKSRDDLNPHWNTCSKAWHRPPSPHNK